MRKTKEEAALTRKRLLEAAVRVFSEKGFTASKLSEIADKAGVTRGAIYWHFGNKEKLLFALFKERTDPYFKLIAEIIDAELSPLAKIQKLVSTILLKLESDRSFQANEKLNLMQVEKSCRSKEAQKYFEERKNSYSDIVTEIIKTGQRQGEIRKDIAAELITVGILALMHGSAFQLSFEPARDKLLGSARVLAEIFITGIKA